jgi:hypothetical protein
MRKFYSVCLAYLLLLLCSQNAKAQDTAYAIKDSLHIRVNDSLALDALKDSIDLLIPVKSYFQASLTYLSNNVYLGRKDTAATPYITPMFGYYHKTGLYLNASASYLPIAGESRIDLVTVEAGYAFKTGKFEGQASAAKFWYNSASYNIRSELKGSLSFFGAYDFGFIKPTLTPALTIGNKLDFALTMGVEHIFYFDHDAFDITPTFNANASTQNYYNSYYKARKFSVKRKGENVTVKGYRSGEVLNAGQLKMLDYEFTFPINYTIKKFTLNFSPVFAVPVNAALVSVTTKKGNQAPTTKIATEKLSNSFFFQGGITYKL